MQHHKRVLRDEVYFTFSFTLHTVAWCGVYRCYVAWDYIASKANNDAKRPHWWRRWRYTNEKRSTLIISSDIIWLNVYTNSYMLLFLWFYLHVSFIFFSHCLGRCFTLLWVASVARIDGDGDGKVDASIGYSHITVVGFYDEKTVKRGINGAIFALVLDMHELIFCGFYVLFKVIVRCFVELSWRLR